MSENDTCPDGSRIEAMLRTTAHSAGGQREGVRTQGLNWQQGRRFPRTAAAWAIRPDRYLERYLALKALHEINPEHEKVRNSTDCSKNDG